MKLRFRALKSSGFNIEDTHLTDIERIDKLFALVLIAFTWAYVVGIYVHQNLKNIKIKKHGRRENSLFKHGLTVIVNVLLNPKKPLEYRHLQIFVTCLDFN
ncbi:MAG: hypothetical protein LBS88_09875 [Tannerellaceae bacterium]|nr:hypothetical protein [Tannerellaceae bacterium]